MTRARDTLLLVVSVSEKQFSERWSESAESNPTAPLAAKSYADWVRLWFVRNRGGQSPFLRWKTCDDFSPNDGSLGETEFVRPGIEAGGDTGEWSALRQRLAWKYPFAAATIKPAKTSVSALRRQAAQLMDEEEALSFEFRVSGFGLTRNPKPGARNVSAADIGTAHHTFLQFVSLDRLEGLEALRNEARRMVHEQVLSVEEAGLLNFESLAAFWQTEFGRKVLAQTPHVRRELPFTARFSLVELAAITGEQMISDLADEFVIVQGVADLAVILPEEIWLMDFKTDEVTHEALAGRAASYEPQLRLYAGALARIYRRPVTDCALYFLSQQTLVPVGPVVGKSY
jgi:ATP-dependent helicase/nuclease subunit A